MRQIIKIGTNVGRYLILFSAVLNVALKLITCDIYDRAIPSKLSTYYTSKTQIIFVNIMETSVKKLTFGVGSPTLILRHVFCEVFCLPE